MASVVQVRGLDELKKNLATLSARVGGEITTRALMKGGALFRAEAKRRAPVLAEQTRWRKPGTLKSAIAAYPMAWNRIKVRVRSRTYIFGPKNAKGHNWAGNANYWWLVEFGTSKMRPRPFMRPAFESQKYAALQAITDEYRAGVLLAVNGMHKYKLTRAEKRAGALMRA